MEQLEKSYFDVSCRKISTAPSEKEGVFYVEETFSLRLKHKGKSIIWIVVLEIYEKYKVIMVSFFLKIHQHNSKIRQFHRNKGSHCIDPFATLCLFRHCFEICRNSRDESFSFGFYAIDDELTKNKEDMNKRMSSYTSFLSRIALKKLPGFRTAGNVTQNLLLVYDPKFTSIVAIEKFISVYMPIVEREIEYLYKERDSHKL